MKSDIKISKFEKKLVNRAALIPIRFQRGPSQETMQRVGSLQARLFEGWGEAEDVNTYAASIVIQEVELLVWQAGVAAGVPAESLHQILIQVVAQLSMEHFVTWLRVTADELELTINSTLKKYSDSFFRVKLPFHFKNILALLTSNSSKDVSYWWFTLGEQLKEPLKKPSLKKKVKKKQAEHLGILSLNYLKKNPSTSKPIYEVATGSKVLPNLSSLKKEPKLNQAKILQAVKDTTKAAWCNIDKQQLSAGKLATFYKVEDLLWAFEYNQPVDQKLLLFGQGIIKKRKAGSLLLKLTRIKKLKRLNKSTLVATVLRLVDFSFMSEKQYVAILKIILQYNRENPVGIHA